MTIQNKDELDTFYKKADPWGYEGNPSDANRKAVLLGELSRLPKEPRHTLDIGCGHGFLTRDLPGGKVTGVDFSKKAVDYANKTSKNPNHTYIAADMFDLTRELLNEPKGFDLILITGVLYPQYIDDSRTLIYRIFDELLVPGGYLVSVHITNWYTSRFPYVMTKNLTYDYREYRHIMEIYEKI